MSTFARDWKPRNLGGRIYYDPRRELEYWADSVDRDQPMVAVPVATLRAAAAVRECHATHLAEYDEDGRLPHPITINCRLIEGHDGRHHNGYSGWESAPPVVFPRASGGDGRG